MKHKQTSMMQKLTSFAALATMAVAMAPVSFAAAGDLTDAQILVVPGSQELASPAPAGFPNATNYSYTVSYTVQTSLDATDKIDVVFPAGFDVSGATVSAVTGGSVSAFTSSVAGQIVTATIDTGSVSATNSVELTIDGVDAPTSAQLATFTVRQETTADALEDDNTNVVINVAPNATITLDNDATAAGDVEYTFDIDDNPALTAANRIVLTFDGDISLTNVAPADVTLTGSGDDGNETVTINTADNEVIIDLGGAATVAAGGDNLSIVIADVDHTALTTPGVYGVGIDYYTDNTETTLIVQGLANADISSSVDITAIVTEALIMTLTGGTSITLQVDPAVNNGQDLTESTGIRVQTNAGAGYTLQARLDDGNGVAQLRDNNGNVIPSSAQGADADNENYFGYTGANNTTTPDAASAEQGFSATSTNLYSDDYTSNSATLGNAAPVDPTVTGDNVGDHTINYDLNVSFLTPAGVYTGTIFYTVIANF